MATQGALATTADALEDKGDFVRRFEASTDAKDVKMLVGQGIMERLARANQAFITHPLVILLVIPLGLILDHFMNFFPASDNPLTWPMPLVGPALIAIPILGIAEYLHRPAFTAWLRKVIGAVDMVRPEAFYSSSNDARSGVWVFSHDGMVCAVVAIDGWKAGQELDSVLGEEEGQLGEKGALDGVRIQQAPATPASTKREGLRKRATATAASASSKKATTAGSSTEGIVQIRHLDVDQPFRQKGVASDLLLSALDHAFAAAPNSPSDSKSKSYTPAKKVIVRTNPLSQDREKLFTKFAFTPVSEEEIGEIGLYDENKIGLLGWQGRWLAVDRETWIAKRVELLQKSLKQ